MVKVHEQNIQSLQQEIAVSQHCIASLDVDCMKRHAYDFIHIAYVRTSAHACTYITALTYV